MLGHVDGGSLQLLLRIQLRRLLPFRRHVRGPPAQEFFHLTGMLSRWLVFHAAKLTPVRY